MDRVIDPLASGLGDGIGWLADHGVLFASFAALWVAFGVALVMSHGSLDQAWATIRGLPLGVQILAWLLFLPVMAGLWIWETTWPLVVRVVLIVSIAGWNLLVFLPRALQTARP
jgi:hypothetical protein